MLAPRRPLSALLLALCLALPAGPAAPQEAPPATQSAPPTERPPADSPSIPPNPPQTLPEQPAAATGEGAKEPAPPPPAPIPGAGPDRIDFQLQFPPDQGGGSAAGSAASLEYRRDDYAVLSGGVHIRYQDVEVKALVAEIDLDTKIITARGDVVVDQGPRRLTGATLEYDLDTKTGKLTQATAHVAPDYYFSGAEVEKISENVYTVTDGVFTSCNQEVPDWSFRLGSARVELEGYAHVRSATMRAKRIPVFYTPYILWPAKTERSSGFLIPNVGYSERRGAALGFAYYLTLGRSYDTTFHLDTYSRSYLGFGNEFRYRPSEGTRGEVLGYVVRDPEFIDEEWRWKVEWNHETTDLPWGMRGVVTFQDFSDFEFFRDFERDFDRNTRRFIDSRAFLTRNSGPHLLTFLLNDRETFVGAPGDPDTVNERRLPELEYRLRSTRLGRTPFYLQFLGSASFLDIERPTSFSGSYGRLDAFPQVTLPVRSFPWLSLSVTGGGRLTYWQDSLDLTGQRLDGESLTRALPSASAEIVGPSFSRLFDWSLGGFGRFKHVIEPRWTYTYLGEFDERPEVPLFDEIDQVGTANFGRFVLANRFLGKPKEGQGSAREVFYFELGRSFSFDDESRLPGSGVGGRNRTSREGPIEALARFNPGERTSFKAEAAYDTDASSLTGTALSGNYGFRANQYVGLTWFTRFAPETGDTIVNQLRVSGGLDVLPKKLRLDGQVNYDIEGQLLQQQIYTLNWLGQCYGVRLEWRDFRAGVGVGRARDKDFRFLLSLKNVGTFLDLTSRSSTRQEP